MGRRSVGDLSELLKGSNQYMKALGVNEIRL